MKRTFTLIKDRLTRSGYSDNGLMDVSNETVSFPANLLDQAVIVKMPQGVKGVQQLVSRIDLNGKSYLVLGEVK